MRRTCNDLGVCQGRTPPCAYHCQRPVPMYPIQVDGPYTRPALGWVRLRRWACGWLKDFGRYLTEPRAW